MKPRVLKNFFQADSFLRVCFQKFGHQIFGYTGESFGPLDLKLQDVLKEFILVGPFKWRASSEEFEHEDTQVPDIETFIMTALFDHFWGQILWSTTICQSSSIAVKEVRPAKICQLN